MFIIEVSICILCVGGWMDGVVGNGMKTPLIISWYLYVYAFMLVRDVLSCMALCLYGVFACVFYLWLKRRP